MKILMHKYQLRPNGGWNGGANPHPCEGVLLKIEYDPGKFGYADFHPWPTLGDGTLAQHIADLKRGRISQQLEQSMWMAKRDADIREKRIRVLADLPRVKNHFLIMDTYRTGFNELNNAKQEGFTSVKLKVGKSINQEIAWLNDFGMKFNFKFRLDFNASLSFAEFQNFYNQIFPPVAKKIEYVEDPCPYNAEHWLEIKKTVQIAIDREIRKVNFYDIDKNNVPFHVVIFKPVFDEPERIKKLCTQYRLKLVVTSNLDHPVGIIHATWIAGEIKKEFPLGLMDCGLMSMRAYAYTDFDSLIKVEGPYISEVQGLGIGFDILFERLEWKPYQSF